jgi:hypothetical protein
MERVQISRPADPDVAAAIAAAIARFQADTEPAAAPEGPRGSAWRRAALAEGVGAKATVQRHLEGGGDRWLS